MLITYKTVQNIIAAHFTRLSRKHTNVIKSVELWMKYLCEEKGYMAQFIQHPGEDAPFLIHWMSSWQMNVSYLFFFFFISHIKLHFSVRFSPVQLNGVLILHIKRVNL